MSLKKESRLLLIDRVDDHIVALVIRGSAGVENILVFDNCLELQKMLELRKGIMAEVNYVVENSVCENINYRTISLSLVRDRDVIEAVKEASKIILIAKLRFTEIKSRIGLRNR